MAVLAEFTCARDVTEDADWMKNDMQVADLRVRVWDNNLTTIEFVKDTLVLGTYRLCWRAFHELVADGTVEWITAFAEDSDKDGEPLILPSCIDEEVMLECVAEYPRRVIITIGKTNREIVFNGLRGDFLNMMDRASMEIEKQPDQGCYKNLDADSEGGGIRVVH